MALKKSTGVYWSDEALLFVERSGNKVTQLFSIPLSGRVNATKTLSPEDKLSLEDLESVRNYLQKNNVKIKDIDLSLPTKDIIFRSFVMPWMQSNEIANAVELNVDKYLPFSLKELSYCYHPVKIIQDGVRRIRVIFIAIKKNSLLAYVNCFKKLGLNVRSVEPADLTLINALATFNHIPVGEAVTLVKKYRDKGKLLIVDRGVPLFVRDFALDAYQGNADKEKQHSKLLNEIRISLDYFNRQDQQVSTKKIILLTALAERALSQSLQTGLGLEVCSVESRNLPINKPFEDVNYLHAYGLGLTSLSGFKVDFNSGSLVGIEGDQNVFIHSETSFDYKKIIAPVLLTLIIFGLAFFAPTFLTKNLVIKKEQIENKLGVHKNKTQAQIEQDKKVYTDKFLALKKVRHQSDIASVLYDVSQILPRGVWLKGLDLKYQPLSNQNSGDASGKNHFLELNMFGYSFSEQSNKQLMLVNTFLDELKNQKHLASVFDHIDINNINVETIEENQVTSFRIRCY